MKHITYFLLIFLFVIYTGCEIQTSDLNAKNEAIILIDPIEIQFYTIDSMRYLIISSGHYSGGMSIVNLTLDKEKLKYYKTQNENYNSR